ncbi:hypothetical protein [Anaerobacillus alkalidiazotrophicus]|nr:hypothetical protein [Anaerobacillus alkalidiazotrophicus]
MTNKKKRNNSKGGSQKGNTHNDGLTSDNILSYEELEKSISPTGRQNSKQ